MIQSIILGPSSHCIDFNSLPCSPCDQPSPVSCAATSAFSVSSLVTTFSTLASALAPGILPIKPPPKKQWVRDGRSVSSWKTKNRTSWISPFRILKKHQFIFVLWSVEGREIVSRHAPWLYYSNRCIFSRTPGNNQSKPIKSSFSYPETKQEHQIER